MNDLSFREPDLARFPCLALAFEAMRRGDAVEMGLMMDAGHMSLRDDFEISNDQLNAMVTCALKENGCYGARMTGGGFGGCTVNLVAETSLSDFERQLEPLVDDWSARSIVVGTPEQARVTEVIT